MQQILTLTIITKDHKVLLGLKKRGFGLGKLNGFGGKVEMGETIEEAAIREVFEETSLELKAITKIGIIDFFWQDKADHLEVHLFHSNSFQGEAQESAEMKPAWYEDSKIPYHKMWDDDKYWFPLLLKGKKFTAKFTFDKKNKVVQHEIHTNRL